MSLRSSLLLTAISGSVAVAALAAPPAHAPNGATSAAEPFGPGETLTYDVKFGPLRVGTGEMTIVGLDTVRGHTTYHARVTIRGGIPAFGVNDLYETWMDTATLTSYRYVQQIHEGRYERTRRYEIYPERRTYELAGETHPSVADPLDEGAFFYFIRTVPLDTGKTYTYDRYFQADRNPVTIKVLRRERVTVPAGTFDAIVLQPTIKANGIFGQGGHAEVWVSEGPDRAIVQLTAKLSFGTLGLQLKGKR